jgi:nucleoside-diphosphate-sugar epimerase
MSALQKGETVLITGGTGWLGTHIANEALAAGLKIRLAIRSEAKAKSLIDALEKIHGKDKHIETVIVEDFVHDGAYDEAIKGVDGIIHAASDVTFTEDYEKVVKPVVKAYHTLFKAAHDHKQVRRIIITSSSVALGWPNPTKKTQHFDVNSWNEVAEKSTESKDGFVIYSASKVLSERIVWDFVKNKDPSFVVTTINPNMIIGAAVPGLSATSTGKSLVDAAQGKQSMLTGITPQYQCDVDDVAKLHVIALMREDVKNERIIVMKDRFNYNKVIDLIRKLKPDAKTEEKKDEWNVEDNTTVDVARANELLKEQGGLRDLEYSIRGALKELQ